MKPDFSTRPRPRPARPLDVALIALAAIAAVWAAHSAWTVSRKLVAARQGLATLRAEAAAEATRLRAVEARLTGEQAKLVSRAVLTAQAPPPRVLAHLQQVLPSGARLDGVVLRYDEQLEIEFTVVAREASRYDQFLERLEASSAFENVTFGSEERGGEVRVTIRGRYRGNRP